MDTNLDLDELIRLLRTRFSYTTLKAIRDSLDLDSLGLHLTNTTNRAHLALFLVGSLYKQNRIGDLLDLCDQYRQGFSQEILHSPFNITVWEPKNTLSEKIITHLNHHLGTQGEPYIIHEPNSTTTPPRETGCYCWYFPDTDQQSYELLTECASLWETLYEIRRILPENQITAYISQYATPADSTHSRQHIPVIVVAPTPSQFDAIRIEETVSGNMGLNVRDWLKILHELDQKYGIDLVAVTDWYVELKIIKKLDMRSVPSLIKYLNKKFCHNQYPDFFDEISPERLKYPIMLTEDD